MNNSEQKSSAFSARVTAWRRRLPLRALPRHRRDPRIRHPTRIRHAPFPMRRPAARPRNLLVPATGRRHSPRLQPVQKLLSQDQRPEQAYQSRFIAGYGDPQVGAETGAGQGENLVVMRLLGEYAFRRRAMPEEPRLHPYQRVDLPAGENVFQRDQLASIQTRFLSWPSRDFRPEFTTSSSI